jgi:PAS domain S-box-containing protein
MPDRLLMAGFAPAEHDAAAGGLIAAGYHVLTAADAAEVVEQVSAGRPRVVLIGRQLPGEDIARLSRRIRRRLREVEIFLVAEDAGQAAAAPLPVDAILPKPASPDLIPLLLAGARERVALKRRLRRERRLAASRTERETARRVETERFLTVKQIVDKLSAFIGQIARDVEGGVRYFDEMPYFVAIHDRRGKVLAANRSYRVLLGRRPGDASAAVYEGRSAEPENSPVGRTLRTANAQESREIIRYRSGARVPAIVHTAPIYTDEGEVELVLEVSAGSRDVEDLRRSVGSSQQRYQLIFDSVPCFVAVLDREQRVAANNRAFVEEFGDKVGAAFRDIFLVEEEAFGASPVLRTLQNGRSSHGEMVLTGPNGRRYTLLVWAAPMSSAAGKLMQVLLIFLDVTQIRELQSNLSSLGLMIGSISHSIKGVLTGLDAGVYLLNKGFVKRDSSQMESGLDIVRRMVERIRRMILDILFCAKERELGRESVDVNRFAEDLLLSCRPYAAGKNVQLSGEVADGLGWFEVDPNLLRSAVNNLLENAVDACAVEGSLKDYRVVLHVEASAEAVGISVEDNGIGMTPEQLKNLFTVFFSTKGIQGTGLGLFITDRIIRRHGGDITVESSPGLGSRFCLLIPRKAPRQPETPAPDATTKPFQAS